MSVTQNILEEYSVVFHQLIEELSEWVPLWLSEASWDCVSRSDHLYPYRVVVHSFHTFPRGDSGVPQYLLVFPYLIYVTIRINDIVARYRSYSQLVYVSFDCTVLSSRMVNNRELTGILSRCNILCWESLFEHTFIVKVNKLYQKNNQVQHLALFLFRNSYFLDEVLDHSSQSFESDTYNIILRKYHTSTNSVYILNNRIELCHYEDTHYCLYVVVRLNLEEVYHESSREEEHKSNELCHYSYAHSLGR